MPTDRDQNVLFEGIGIDECAKRASVILWGQYGAYCKRFLLPVKIRSSDCRMVKEIRRASISVGPVTMQIRFTLLDVLLDIKFMVIAEDIPTLLSLQDMVDNGPDTSIQECFASLGDGRPPPKMDNYFPVHKWKPEDVPRVRYTELEIRLLHWTFEHPSVRALGLI